MLGEVAGQAAAQPADLEDGLVRGEVEALAQNLGQLRQGARVGPGESALQVAGAPVGVVDDDPPVDDEVQPPGDPPSRAGAGDALASANGRVAGTALGIAAFDCTADAAGATAVGVGRERVEPGEEHGEGLAHAGGHVEDGRDVPHGEARGEALLVGARLVPGGGAEHGGEVW